MLGHHRSLHPGAHPPRGLSRATDQDTWRRDRSDVTTGYQFRLIAIAGTVVLLTFATLLTIAVFKGAALRGEVGYDADLYAAIGQHFLATGEAYYPAQSMPYAMEGEVNLYPPTALYLFVPASFTPRILWWIVPLAVIAWSLYRLRPAWWAWPLMAGLALLPLEAPAIPVGLVYGNTTMWTVAALFAAAAFRPGVAWATVFKPTDFLFAIPFAVRSWRGLVVAVALSLALLPLWFDWFHAMANAEGASPLRGVTAWPALTVPIIAWWARGPSRIADGQGLREPLEAGPTAPW